MKNFTLLLFAMLLTSFAWSQSKVTGTVKDTDNNPVPGANVIEKGTKNGTTTGFDGDFSLNIADNAILVVSYTGYDSKEVAINGKKVVNIVLTTFTITYCSMS